MSRKLIYSLVVLMIVFLGSAVVMRGQTQTQTYICNTGFGEELLPPVLLTSLQTVPNPVIPIDPITGQRTIRGDLVDYVANLDAAIRLGKALFWDVQVGSDNKVSCATCHFQAGQDGRTRNQFHPGANGQWDGFTPNQDAWAGAYPFTVGAAISDVDNITGSQGVRRTQFGGINTRTGAETNTAVSDPVFNVGGTNVRRVTGRNAPSVINAVFNHRNFFDGRAQAEFNGVNPFGDRDPNARVYYLGALGVTPIDIHIKNASLASQAVGPVLNDTEMSAAGRTFPDVGQKLLLLKPLGLQKVDPSDSVLGAYADPNKGLTLTYQQMIQAAFKPKWWNATSKQTVKIGGKTYTLTAANTSLFWGLSVMLYEATLVSDQTPMDAYLKSRATAANPALLDPLVAQLQADMPGLTRDEILAGLSLFELPPPPAPAPNGVGCALCHVSAELTSASARNITAGVEAGDLHFTNGGFDQRLERMFLQLPPVPVGTDVVSFNPSTYQVTSYNSTKPSIPPQPVGVGTYDVGYYNIGVRKFDENPGENGVDPFGNSLSIIKLLQAQNATYVKVPGNALNCGATVINNPSGYPLLSGPLSTTENTFVDATYKTPGLRNVELTAPYFHNGGKATLMQVLEFYDDGSNFPGNPTLAPAIKPLGLSPAQMRAVVAFLLSLTDERVRSQKAPFDHPQLFVPNGDSTVGTDNLIEIPATGAAGGAPLQRFMGLNPFGS